MNETSWTPARLLETSGSYWAACAIHAGLKLDIFSALAAGSGDLEQLATATGCDRRALGMLLDALTAMGLVNKSGASYRNTPFAAQRLDRQSPDYMGYILLHHHQLMPGWAQLSQAVRSGQPVRTSASHTPDGEERQNFLMGMFNMASLVAPHMARQLDLSGATRLLDLGGGPGTYAIHFCLANPHLEAVILDLPSTRVFAETMIARFNLQDRITFHDGDFLSDAPPGTFDVAWLSHVLHGEAPQGCHRLLQQAAAALRPGGQLLIHEFILDDDRSGPLFSALFSLNMLIATAHGQAYTGMELRTMLQAVGAQTVERLTLELPGPSGVMAATL